jgi:hypothetical protein
VTGRHIAALVIIDRDGIGYRIERAADHHRGGYGHFLQQPRQFFVVSPCSYQNQGLNEATSRNLRDDLDLLLRSNDVQQRMVISPAQRNSHRPDDFDKRGIGEKFERRRAG